MSQPSASNPFPARLHVLLAREAPTGLVIRRGPSDRVCVLGWDRRKDTFQVGQWLHGRIYERRSDLSPDGKYWIYFAMNGKWDSESRGAWSAVARAPYLKAVSFYPKGDCWHGGGLFLNNQTYWLNNGYGHTTLREAPELRRDPQTIPKIGPGGECLSVYYPRLLRDSWSIITPLAQNPELWSDQDLWEKGLPLGWKLRKIAHAGVNPPPGKGCYWDEHQLYHPKSGACYAYPDWEWAERDGNRLVWAEGGKLWAGVLTSEGLSRPTLLHDFNGMTFELLTAPY